MPGRMVDRKCAEPVALRVGCGDRGRATAVASGRVFCPVWHPAGILRYNRAMLDDAELLRRYVGERSEAAFAELVRRHLDLVYSAALRQVDGDVYRAQDVAQTVFTLLAGRAPALADHPGLTGWLYLTAQHVAAKVMRAERRRQARERKAALMNEADFQCAEPTVDWERTRPVLDAAMRELTDVDREAVLLRFFARRPFGEIGRALRLSEDGARRRVERALDKLHALLAKRGVTSTTAALGVALQANAVAAAPTGLAAVVTGSAVSAAVTGGGALSAIKLLAFMNTSKIGVTMAVLVAATAVGTALVELRIQQTSEAAAMKSEVSLQVLASRAAELRRRVDEEAQRVANARRIQLAPPAVLGKPIEAAKPAEPDADELAGREFVAKHPEAQALVDGMARQTFDKNFGQHLRAMNVTAAEHEILAREVMSAGNWVLRIAGNGGWSTGPRNRQDYARTQEAIEQRFRELLGPERAAQFAEQMGLAPVNALLSAVAAASYDAAAPLTAEQTQLVTQTIMSHGGRMTKIVSGTTLAPAIADLSQVDWPEVSRRLAGALAPVQLAALETAAANETAKSNRRQAEQKFIVPASPPKTGGG